MRASVGAICSTRASACPSGRMWTYGRTGQDAGGLRCPSRRPSAARHSGVGRRPGSAAAAPAYGSSGMAPVVAVAPSRVVPAAPHVGSVRNGSRHGHLTGSLRLTSRDVDGDASASTSVTYTPLHRAKLLAHVPPGVTRTRSPAVSAGPRPATARGEGRGADGTGDPIRRGYHGRATGRTLPHPTARHVAHRKGRFACCQCVTPGVLCCARRPSRSEEPPCIRNARTAPSACG